MYVAPNSRTLGLKARTKALKAQHEAKVEADRLVRNLEHIARVVEATSK